MNSNQSIFFIQCMKYSQKPQYSVIVDIICMKPDSYHLWSEIFVYCCFQLLNTEGKKKISCIYVGVWMYSIVRLVLEITVDMLVYSVELSPVPCFPRLLYTSQFQLQLITGMFVKSQILDFYGNSGILGSSIFQNSVTTSLVSKISCFEIFVLGFFWSPLIGQQTICCCFFANGGLKLIEWPVDC